MEPFEKKIIKDTSIPLPGGGDTHIHPHPGGDFTITTRLPTGGFGSVDIHDKPGQPPDIGHTP